MRKISPLTTFVFAIALAGGVVERGASHLPVVFLVHVTQGHRIGKDLIQIRHAVFANPLIECDGQLDELVVRLNFSGVLVQDRLRAL